MAAEEQSAARPIFVHFVPPPLRERGKGDLPWIVHTCDGSGCREAKHVTFNSISGFSTYEGAPPEQAEGRACSCPIANHHLRGYGQVRWVGDAAFIEHDGLLDDAASANGGSPLVNIRAFKDEARRREAQLAGAREQVKRLREMGSNMSKQLDESLRQRDEQETGAVKELSVLRVKKNVVEDKYRALAAKYNTLKAENERLMQAQDETAAAAAAMDAAAAPVAIDADHLSSDDELLRLDHEANHLKINLGCWSWVVVCVAPKAARDAANAAAAASMAANKSPPHAEFAC